MTSRQAALLAALAGLWGASYLLIKYALEDLSAPMIVFGRTALAALVLLAFMGSAKRVALTELRRRPLRAVGLGALSVAAPFLLITLGELEVPSGLTAVLIAPAPLFVALFAPALDRAEVIGRAQALGLVSGMAGVALLVGLESVQSLGEFLGAIAIIAAAACYAAASMIVRRVYDGIPAIGTSFISVSTAALLTLPPALATAPAEMPGTRALVSMGLLAVGGTALAFIIFYHLIATIGAGRASLVSYLIPPVSLAYGALLLDEEITLAAIAGLVLILGGVGLASRAGSKDSEAAESPPEPAPIGPR